MESPRVVNLRGTSGSGKSHIVRAIMAQFPHKVPVHLEGRKQPIGYALHQDFPPAGGSLYVIGHYETPCGGCDTISVPGTIDFIYGTIRSRVADGYSVLYEGLIVESDVKRCIGLYNELKPNMLVVGLTTPAAECLAGIQARRDTRGDTRPLDPSNTVNRIPQIEARMKRLKAAGVDARWMTRSEALASVQSFLGLSI